MLITLSTIIRLIVELLEPPRGAAAEDLPPEPNPPPPNKRCLQQRPCYVTPSPRTERLLLMLGKA